MSRREGFDCQPQEKPSTSNKVPNKIQCFGKSCPMQVWKVLAVLLALQALTQFTAARHMPLRQPGDNDAQGITSGRGQQLSAEVEGTQKLSVQPHSITRHRKLLQGVAITRMAAEMDGTMTADGKDLCKTDACRWIQGEDSVKLAGILGGMVLGAGLLCCGCLACTIRLCGRKDETAADRADPSVVRVTSEMWAMHCKKKRPPVPMKPGKKCLPAKAAAEKIAVVVDASSSAVPAEAITISIESCSVKEAGVQQSSERKSTAEEDYGEVRCCGGH